MSVTRANDHKSSGRWVVKVSDKNNGNETTSESVFDAVMICTGHHVRPFMPRLKGEEKFRGRIMHSHSFRSACELEGRNVVVVGVGNSGGDVAVDVGHVANKCYMSTRRGTWILKRVAKNGIPGDVRDLTRFWNIVFNTLPYNFTNYMMESELNATFDHKLYGLKPTHRALSQHPMVNDSLPNRIITGRVIIKSNIQEFVEDGVIFEGDDKVTKVDTVILATGYSFWFPFLDRDVLEYDQHDNIVDLYKFMFNPALDHPETLPFIGLFQTIGAGFPAGELQVRWFIELMKGNVQLPSKEEMLREIHDRKEYVKKRFVDTARHRHNVDYINFMDDLSSQIGARPNLWYYFFTDPVLWYYLFFGPSLPYQYRLQGPDSCPSLARRLILSYRDRIEAPLKTRIIDEEAKEAVRAKEEVKNRNNNEEEGKRSDRTLASSLFEYFRSYFFFTLPNNGKKVD